MIGQDVAGYSVLDRLGVGATGEVYFGRQKRSGRCAAIKLLLPKLSQDQTALARFFNEVRASSLIRHPGIVELVDIDIIDDHAVVITEYLEGESLGAYLRRTGTLEGDLPFLLGLGCAAASAVGAAHASNIIHRYLKPGNIYLHLPNAFDSAVTVKILDFGIDKLAQAGSAGQTSTGALLGPPTYMSPEQCRGASVDPRSDVYSLGCILYEALCGQPPFVRQGARDLIVAHVSETPDPPSRRVNGLAPSVDSLVMGMLAKKPDQRPQSMEDASKAIEACAREAGIALSRTTLRPRRPVQASASSEASGSQALATPPIMIGFGADRQPEIVRLDSEQSGSLSTQAPDDAHPAASQALPAAETKPSTHSPPAPENALKSATDAAAVNSLDLPGDSLAVQEQPGGHKPSEFEIPPGTVIANTYVVTRPIGHGGMGAVYEVQHRRTKAPLAMKVLLAGKQLPRELLVRFRREAEVTSNLNHPNIVRVFDFDTLPDGRPFLIMELLEGRELSRLLEARHPLPLPVVAGIVEQIAQGLSAAHQRGIVHRDLKPANVFLTSLSDGRELVKLLDFGISKVRNSGTNLTNTQAVIGTPHYMSPEQAYGRMDQVDARTDQFALATIAYELVCGQMAFSGDEALSVLFRVVNESPTPLSALVPGLPTAVEKVVNRGMAKRAADRFASAQAFAKALTDACGAGAARSAHEATAAALDRDGESVTSLPPAGDTALLPPITTLRFATGQAEPTPVAQQLEKVRRWPRKGLAVSGAVSAGAVIVVLIVHGSSPPSPRRVKTPHAATLVPPVEEPPAAASPPGITPPPAIAPAPTELDVSHPITAPSLFLAVPPTRPPVVEEANAAPARGERAGTSNRQSSVPDPDRKKVKVAGKARPADEKGPHRAKKATAESDKPARLAEPSNNFLD